MQDNQGRAYLLDLDGQIFIEPTGHWWKINAHKVTPDVRRPHGLSYSLTLHDNSGARIIGYDNAHPVKPTRQRRYAARKTTWDHKHLHKQVIDYAFENPSQLLADFLQDVNRVVNEALNDEK